MLKFVKAYKNKIFGFLAVAIYIYALSAMEEFFPGLIATKNCGSSQALFGFNITISMPAIGIVCLLIPIKILEQISHNMEILTPLVVTESFILFIGYLILAISIAVFTLFMK